MIRSARPQGQRQRLSELPAPDRSQPSTSGESVQERRFMDGVRMVALAYSKRDVVKEPGESLTGSPTKAGVAEGFGRFHAESRGRFHARVVGATPRLGVNPVEGLYSLGRHHEK